MAKDRKPPDSRYLLRNAIRRWVRRIELYRTVPKSLTTELRLPDSKQLGVRIEELLHARCIRIVFYNDTERWIVDRDSVVRLDGKVMPPRKRFIMNRDEFGGKVILDMASESSVTNAPERRVAALRQQTDLRGGKDLVDVSHGT